MGCKHLYPYEEIYHKNTLNLLLLFCIILSVMEEYWRIVTMSKNKRMVLTLVICGVVLAGLVLAGGATAVYFYFNGQYNDAVDTQKEKIAALNRNFEQGTGDSGVSLSEECNLYDDIGKKLSEASDSLAELNDKYPLLLNKATDESVGITALKTGLEAIAPKIKKLRETIEENESISKALTALLEKELDENSTKAYQDLAGRNSAIDGVVTTLSFTGSLEDKRKVFCQAIQQRGLAMDFFLEDSKIQDAYRTLSADTTTGLAELSQQFTALLGQCESLEGKLPSSNLKGIAPDGLDLSANFNNRKVSIQASVDYLTEAATVQNALKDYCVALDKSIPKGKFLQKLDYYVKWLAKLEGFEASLKELNAKPNYVNVAGKRSLEGLGLSEKGKMVLSYRKAVKDVKAAMATSASIDSQITKLLADKKAKPASIKKSAAAWATKNREIIKTLSVALPDDLKAGAAKVLSGCKERANFLTEWIAYQADKATADSHNASYSAHMKKANDYAATGLYYYYYIDGYWSSNVEKYYQLMLKEEKAAKAEKAKANAAMKLANAHKTKYDASRKKYRPLMNP